MSRVAQEICIEPEESEDEETELAGAREAPAPSLRQVLRGAASPHGPRHDATSASVTYTDATLEEAARIVERARLSRDPAAWQVPLHSDKAHSASLFLTYVYMYAALARPRGLAAGTCQGRGGALPGRQAAEADVIPQRLLVQGRAAHHAARRAGLVPSCRRSRVFARGAAGDGGQHRCPCM